MMGSHITLGGRDFIETEENIEELERGDENPAEFEGVKLNAAGDVVFGYSMTGKMSFLDELESLPSRERIPRKNRQWR